MGPEIAHGGVAKGPARGQQVWMSAGAQARTEGLGSLAEALDRILCKGVTVDGAVTIGVAGVELIMLDLRLLLAAVDVVNPDGSFFGSASAFIPPEPPAPPAARSGRSASPLPPDPAAAARETGAAGITSALDFTAALTEEPADRKGPQQGLMKLVLTLVNLLHELLERQAVRRMGNGTLTPEEIENIGTALYAQTMEIARLRQQFGLSDSDLSLNLSATG
jgi:hypothetical protein